MEENQLEPELSQAPPDQEMREQFVRDNTARWNAQLANERESQRITMQDISDGYHTFKELYAHRIVLYLLVAKLMIESGKLDKFDSYKSKKHNDGSSIEGWFITGIHARRGWISYHLPMDMWDKCKLPECEVAPPWDGHTSVDVYNRLMDLLQ